MKVEDYIAGKSEAKPEPKKLGMVVAMMATYERAGMLTRTVESFARTAPDVPLTVYDDGSETLNKKAELQHLEAEGVEIVRLPHGGFVSLWMKALEDAASVGAEGFVLLEDDLSFAPGWLDVLRRMHDGAMAMGRKPGAMSCLRVHSEPQGVPVVLGGVEAYQSMMHGFQVNLVSREAVLRRDVLEEAARRSAEGSHGIDVNWIGLLSHRLGMMSYVSMRSWVAHEGSGTSVVKGQGYRSFEHRGFELVDSLTRSSTEKSTSL